MERMVIALLLVSAVHSQDAERLIIGGKPCIPYSRPWQAYVTYDYKYCGGALINPSWVVTAAHCFGRNMAVRLGEHNLRVREGTEQSRKVVKAIWHPRFNNRTLVNDIMLLKLDRRVPLSQYIRPLRLPSGCSRDGTRCYVSGWGRVRYPQVDLPDVPHCVGVQIINWKTCKASYRGSLTSNMICAGVQYRAVGSCKGDSGGALVCNGQLEGIVSWTLGICAQPGYPSVYTKVCKYSNWIREVIKKN